MVVLIVFESINRVFENGRIIRRLPAEPFSSLFCQNRTFAARDTLRIGVRGSGM
jgi:hypothetical protein